MTFIRGFLRTVWTFLQKVWALLGTVWTKFKNAPLAPLITLLSAAIAFIVFYENHHEVFDANDARLNTQVATKSGYGIYLNVTNNGNPSAVISSARLIVPGSRRNMPVNFYLSDPGLIEDYSTDPSRVRAERQPLPIAVDPHTSRTVVLLADPDALAGGRPKANTVRDQLAFCHYVKVKADVANGLIRPELKLGMTWTGLALGGHLLPWFAPDHQNVTVEIAGNKLTQPSWRAEVVGRLNAPRAVMFRHRLAEATTGSIAKMTVYGKPDQGVIYQLERPLVGNTPTAFPLPKLGRGTYLVAFSLDGDVVVTGRLPVPRPEPKYDLAQPIAGFCNTPKMAQPLPAEIAADQQGDGSG